MGIEMRLLAALNPSAAADPLPKKGKVEAGSRGLSRGLFTSLSTDWQTPDDFFRGLDAEFHFTLDACATPGTEKVAAYLSSANLLSALAVPWYGAVFCNPPYGRRIGQWVRHGYESAKEGATVVMLLPSRTDTAWWHDYVMLGEIRFIRGRLHFDGKGPAPFPSAVVVFRP